MKQGCPLSLDMFNLLMTDMEEKMRMGRSEIGGGKNLYVSVCGWCGLVAKKEKGMRSMIERLGRYLDGKGLELNTEKSKVRFRKERGREKVKWRWKKKVIEEVKRYTYLGYTMQRNRGQEVHIRERVKKGAAVMGQVWGIRKRKFKDD